MFSRILLCILCSFQVFADQPTSHAITDRAENLQVLKRLNEKKLDLLFKLESRQQAGLRLIRDQQAAYGLTHEKSQVYSAWDKLKSSQIKHGYPFRLSSDNGRNYLDFHGLLELDQDIFYNMNGLSIYTGLSVQPIYRQSTVDRFWSNHIAPILSAHLDDKVIFYYYPDFGKQQYRTFDAFIDVNYTRQLSFEAGKQKDLASSIESLVDSGQLMVPSFPYMLAPNREIGFFVYGAIGAHRHTGDNGPNDYGLNDAISYQIGLIEGAADNNSPGIIPTIQPTVLGMPPLPNVSLSNKSIEARVFINPFIHDKMFLFQNLGFGVSGSFVDVNNQVNMPAILSLGSNPIFAYEFNVFANGPRARIRPQMIWYYDSFGMNADWISSSQHLNLGAVVQNQSYKQIYQQNKAGQIQLAYNVTHEPFTMSLMKPNNNFHPFEAGSYGALQLIGRVSNLIIDPSSFEPIVINGFNDYISSSKTSVQQALGWTVGLHWYWNDYFSVMMEYDQSSYVGGCSTGAIDPLTNPNPGCLTGTPGGNVINRPSEKVFMQRLKLIF